MIGQISKATWGAIAAAAIVVVGIIAVVATFLTQIGGSEMSEAGWIAMILGILATLALGIGLMSLVFISSRRGYDEPDRWR